MNKERKNNGHGKELKKESILNHGNYRWIKAVLMFLATTVVGLAFLSKAGVAGQWFVMAFNALFGDSRFTAAAVILSLLFGAFMLLKSHEKIKLSAILLTVLLIAIGLSGLAANQNLNKSYKGVIGLGANLIVDLFGMLVANIFFVTVLIISFGIFLQLWWRAIPKEEKEAKNGISKKSFFPFLNIKDLESDLKIRGLEEKTQDKTAKIPLLKKTEEKQKEKKVIYPSAALAGDYKLPPLDLLPKNETLPSAGNIKENSLIIKKTLENFGIAVEMAEVNVGPTVAQYAFKPAEGVKLSKITTLSNNLALALAAHPIRIEAPIPGKSLVGIEVPNKMRANVSLRALIADPTYQNASAPLFLALGKDVSGSPVYTDLAEMPHMLVAGSTGSGKTCHKDTLMFTEKGMLTFEELCPLPLDSEIDFKIKLVTRDGIESTGRNYNNGLCQFYKLTTRRGYQIEATMEHPLWVMNADGSQSWKQAAVIKEGDYVAISRRPNLFGNKTDISGFKPSEIVAHHRKISFPSKMTQQLAQFLGLLTADGGLSVEGNGIYRVVYTQANSQVIAIYKKSLRDLFGITKFIEKTSGSNLDNKATDIEVNSKHLKEFLLHIGMNSSKAPQKEIPRSVREAPQKIVAAYLSALFDNDGCVSANAIELTMSSKKLVSQVHVMLLNFGIVSSLSLKKVKNYIHNEYFRLSIFGEDARIFTEKIGFIRKEKQKKAQKFFAVSSNPNLDLVPNIAFLLKKMGEKYLSRFATLTNRGWKYQTGILVPKYAFNSLRSYNSGFRMPGYQALQKILNFYQPISQEAEYRILQNVFERNFYWDKVEKIAMTSGVGYDFFVPGSDSFVGNGFVNHNTIFLNSLILSFLYKNTPSSLRVIMVDPKRVEFQHYNNIPHLLCPVIYDANKTMNALQWLSGEMERRFQVFSEVHSRDIKSYNQNKSVLAAGSQLPYIVLIIDELADLMTAKGRELETGIVRLSQMARATGIHLVLATQRPSVEVITGLIKANITSRITFQLASQVDSRTVLDVSGAEKLLGSGDMLFLSSKSSKLSRIQTSYISEKEVKRVTDWVSQQEKEIKEPQISLVESLRNSLVESPSDEVFSGDDDPLFKDVKRIVLETRKASASFLQRRLRIGYARAARLIDILEERGIVGPAEGAKPREVYGSVQSASMPMSGGADSKEPAESEEEWEKV